MMTPPTVGRPGSEHSPIASVPSSIPSEDIWRDGSPRCAGCRSMIRDEVIRKVNGKLWHSACLRCTSCRQPLNQFCFANGDELYCEEDFNLYFGCKCAGCGMQMSPNEIVRKLQNNIYHQSCFTCVCCQQDLQTGDRIYLRDDSKLLCEVDYHRLKENSKRSSCDFDSDSDCSTGSGKRLRTNISQQQTVILIQAYQHDPKPSRHGLRQIGVEAGLDTRVVRVWFQNRRAKEKRTNSKKHYSPGQGQGNSVIPNMDDDSCGSFHENDSCRYSKPILEPFISQMAQEYQSRTPSCGRINHYINFMDSLSPESIPPNIDLSASDIKNGEVCLNEKHQNSSSLDSRFHFHNMNTDGLNPMNSPWLPGL